MKRAVLAAAFMLAAAPAFAGGSVVGEYVEARTAEVFAGGCIMSSQAETMGREAVLAWHVRIGRLRRPAARGLSVVAAVAGDRNLGIREIGGEAPSAVRGDRVRRPEGDAGAAACARQDGADALARPHHRRRRREGRAGRLQRDRDHYRRDRRRGHAGGAAAPSPHRGLRRDEVVHAVQRGRWRDDWRYRRQRATTAARSASAGAIRTASRRSRARSRCRPATGTN